MKSIFTIAFAACIFAIGATAEATTAFCFPGWFGGWGAGYVPGSYYASRPYYGGWSTGYYGSYYGGGYNGGACGCSTCNSCSPCGSCLPCGTGCSTGSCGNGCGVINSDSYTPRKDPNFEEGTGERGRDPEQNYDDPRRRWRDRESLDNDLDSNNRFGDEDLDPRRPDPETRPFSSGRDNLGSGSRLDDNSDLPDTNRGEEERDPFSTSPAGDGESRFGDEPDDFNNLDFSNQGTNKPAISDPMPEREVPSGSDEVLSPPNDDSSLLQRGRLSQRDARLSHTTDSSRIRLTGLSRPSGRQSHTRWSGRTQKRSSRTKRWIGIPAVDGRARL